MTHLDFGRFERFKYDPLARPEASIRLIRILPGGHHEPLRCILDEGDRNSEYVCLSYMWGTDKASHPILINNSLFHVGDNLWDFLVHARRTRTTAELRLWIDALSINQQCETEKSAQVAVMGKIYQSATDVLVYLGQGDRFIEYFFDFVARSPGNEHVRLLTLFEWDKQPLKTFYDAFFALASLKYWTRIWTVQEILLAKTITFRYGNKEMPSSRLEKIVEFFLVLSKMYPFQKVLGNIQRIPQTSCAITMNQRIVLEGNVETSLMDLFRRFETYQCREPKDKVYALRSLAANSDRLRVDYSVDMAVLFIEVMDVFGSHHPIADGHRLIRTLGLTANRLSSFPRTSDKDKRWKEYNFFADVGTIVGGTKSSGGSPAWNVDRSVLRSIQRGNSTIITNPASFTQILLLEDTIMVDGKTTPVLQDGDIILRCRYVNIFLVFRRRTYHSEITLAPGPNILQHAWNKVFSALFAESVQTSGDWIAHHELVTGLLVQQEDAWMLRSPAARHLRTPSSKSSSLLPGRRCLRLHPCKKGSFSLDVRDAQLVQTPFGSLRLMLDWRCLMSFWRLLETRAYLFNDGDDVIH